MRKKYLEVEQLVVNTVPSQQTESPEETMTENEVVIRMPPKNTCVIKAKINSVKKAEPRITEPTRL